MDYERLNKIFIECLKELNSIGINFEGKEISILISKRNNKRYGCCKPSIPNEKTKEITRKRI